jgi:Sec-independent protein translocase protein TatA
MNILGVGGPELVVILLIMLVIAGPRRMAKWAYIMGTYIAKFRRMWEETVDVLQKEFDDAGVDIKVPRELPTRGSLNQQARKVMGTVTDPVQETLNQVNTEVKQIKETTTSTTKALDTTVRGTNGKSTPRTRPVNGAVGASSESGFGSWSSHEARPDFGSWTESSSPKDDEE